MSRWGFLVYEDGFYSAAAYRWGLCLSRNSSLRRIITDKRGGDLIIGIIGAGKVGTTLGAYLCQNQIAVSGYYSRTFESAVSAADFTDTVAYYSIGELVDASDTLFIATPDAEIGNTWDCIAKYGLKDKIVCHFSGSLSSYVFSGIETAGAAGCSIHPMFAFSDKFNSYKNFSKACITVEGQERAVGIMRQLFENLGHRVFTVKPEDKMRYHAAAALASNYMVGLFQVSLDLLAACGFSEEESRTLLVPLVRNNVDSMLEKRAEEVLTGPVERGDAGTVREHLRVLHGLDAEAVYRSIGKELVEIAKRRNPERDYTAIERLL
jgi:Uncharacterized conserved protein